MFDNPQRDLQRLQQELMAAEHPEWEAEEEDEEEEPEEDSEVVYHEMKAFLAREDWEEEEREPLYRSYTEEAFDEEDWEEEYAEPAPKKKGTGGLIAAIILEALAVLAMVMWWLLWR